MFKLFYIIKTRFEIYVETINNAFAKTVSEGFKNASENKLAEVKELYHELEALPESHQRENRDYKKDLENKINTMNGEIDEMVDTANNVIGSIERREKEIEIWGEKIKFVKKNF